MAILKDPLFSDEARGQVAKVAVFKRSQVHPVFSPLAYHPQNWTPSRIAAAHAWKNLCNTWRSLSDADQAQWRLMATGVLTGFSFFMQHKGVLPIPPCYVPPPGDSLLYNFSVSPYYPPDWDDLSFSYLWCI